MKGLLVNVSTIQSHFASYGWSCALETELVVTAGFSIGDVDTLIVVQWADPWIRFSIPHLMPIATEKTTPETLTKLLLLNYETRLARFAISPDGLLGIYADLCVMDDEFTYTDFEVALDSLCYFAETAHNRVWDLSQLPVDEV